MTMSNKRTHIVIGTTLTTNTHMILNGTARSPTATHINME